ncbi:DUF362 domain-containing protein [Clostridium ljungdahlii]|uniref:DUF362 domain-containing protein n=1 Tax=Clostridium ljungdahlii TaxID=1538 RepID=A0A168NVS6_9CLOT|nr:DUF362 domain-containing protein [Clostridium ljungdahlii]OAA86973.1 hypothetical protein WY13_02368 [Clostridium ljungdahlii]
MLRDEVSFVIEENVNYPDYKSYCSPSEKYPEYRYMDISKESNNVYKMIRKGFILLRLDKENIGTKEWNPLGSYIKKGDTVLIKPNWVLHVNNEPVFHDMECMVTHPSVIRCVIDYVLIALKGTGKIIVADAPIQKCHFEELQQQMHYAELWEYYHEKGIDISVIDLRDIVAAFSKNGTVSLENHKNPGMLVKLNELSEFENVDNDKISKMRITCYPTDALQSHHNAGKHEYMIAGEVLSADTIINLPKPKSHRKAGMTACAKNFVGICTNKEYLPHHTIGEKASGGDEYLNKNIFLKLASKALDNYNNAAYAQKKSVSYYHYKSFILNMLGHKLCNEKYSEGSWWGNDTIWRTIVDLNYIVKYADKNGVIQNTEQRKIFNICDMIVVGEKEGPMEPSPMKLGAIVMGDECAVVDRFICEIFGFSSEKVPYISYLLNKQNLTEEEIKINYKNKIFKFSEFKFNPKWHVIPTSGWLGHIEQ